MSTKELAQVGHLQAIENWYADAHGLAIALLELRQWRHAKDNVGQRIDAVASRSQSLGQHFNEAVWPGLKLAYCELGDFSHEGMTPARCGWLALQSLTERVVLWGRYLANEQQKRTLNCGEVSEFMEREDFLSKVVDAIRARLLLEESKLLQQNPGPSIENPKKKTSSGQRIRRSKGEQKLTSQGLSLVAALCNWHEIEANGKNVLFDKQKPAIGCREVEREFEIPLATASEQFKVLFGSHRNYTQNWARNPQGLAYQLAMLNGEVFCIGAQVSED
jgi:hypothetical protein